MLGGCLHDTNPATVDEKALSSARMCQVRLKEFPNLLAAASLHKLTMQLLRLL